MACKHGVAGLGGFQQARFQRRAHGGGHGDAVAVQNRQRIGAGAGIGHGGAAGDDGGVVARHIADGEGDHTRRSAGRRQPPALDAREVLAHAVHLANGGTAGQQFFVDALLFGQREAIGRQREQGRAAARDEADHQVIGREPLGERQHALGRLQACGIRHGVGGLHHFNALRQPRQPGGPGRNVVIAGDDQAAERCIGRPQRLQRLRHGAPGLARTQHQRAAFGWSRQMGLKALQGLCALHRHVVQVAQEGGGILARVRHGHGEAL